MKTVQLACLAAVLIGSLTVLTTQAQTTPSNSTANSGTTQQASGNGTGTQNITVTNGTETNNTARESTTATPAQSNKARVNWVIEELTENHCNGTDGKPCTISEVSDDDKKVFCSVLDNAADCIQHCGLKPITDAVATQRKDFNCDGCGFVQGSLVVVLLVALLQFLV